MQYDASLYKINGKDWRRRSANECVQAPPPSNDACTPTVGSRSQLKKTRINTTVFEYISLLVSLSCVFASMLDSTKMGW